MSIEWVSNTSTPWPKVYRCTYPACASAVVNAGWGRKNGGEGGGGSVVMCEKSSKESLQFLIIVVWMIKAPQSNGQRTKPTVILLHGLMRNARCMKKLQR